MGSQRETEVISYIDRISDDSDTNLCPVDVESLDRGQDTSERDDLYDRESHFLQSFEQSRVRLIVPRNRNRQDPKENKPPFYIICASVLPEKLEPRRVWPWFKFD